MPALNAIKSAAAHRLESLILNETQFAAEPADFRAWQDDILAIARVIDPLLEAIGLEANRHAGIDLKQFTNVLRDALEGNATYELECAAERKADALTTYLLSRDEKARAEYFAWARQP